MTRVDTEQRTIVLCDENLDEPQELSWGRGEAYLFTARSPVKDTPNEDSAGAIVVDNDTALFVVADGCGGMASGETASRLAVEHILSRVGQVDSEAESLRGALLDGIESANQAVTNLGNGAATTVAAVEIRENVIRPYHVGDSTILLVGNKGRIKLQTRAHSPVAYAVEAGLIDEDDAIHHENLHLVSNVIGMSDMHIDIGSERKMSPRDTLLIGSDGLFDNLYLEEIIDIIRKGTLKKAARRLIELVRKRMVDPSPGEPSKPDDVTFILVRQRSAKRS